MQEEIHKALTALKFVKEGKYYKKSGNWIKVYEDDSLEDVFKKLMKYSETMKVWEIKRVLQITDPRI